MATEASEAQERYFEGEVVAELPLALLESVRAHDRPGEILEDEDLTVSLPRRLGLSGVIETQIQRYETAQRAGRTVSLNEVFGLIRLVLRRPDADVILRGTGQRIASGRYQRTPETLRKLYRALPLRLALVPLTRRARRLFQDMQVGGDVIAHRHPLTLTAPASHTAELDPSGTACALYTAALEQHLALYTGRAWRVTHGDCRSRGGRACAWLAEPLAL